MATTIKDLAQKVGLSPSAVSLVLNNRPNRISKEKCELIKRAAREMNYLPNQNAVGLVKRRNKAFGVIIPDIKNLFFSEIVSGIESIALEHGWNIIITSSNDKYELDLQNIRMLASREVGAIFIAAAGNAGENEEGLYREALAGFGKPVILIDRDLPKSGFSRVAIDGYRGAQFATEHLLSLGHRRIAFLLGPRAICHERLQGVWELYQEHGLVLSQEDLFDGAYTMESGYALSKKILNHGYTAVFAFNDMMAYGFYKCCREQNVRIPDDISVIGFDDILFSDYLDVPLSTVRQPACDLGAEAARRAFYEIEHKDTPCETIFLTPVLVPRKSTASISK